MKKSNFKGKRKSNAEWLSKLGEEFGEVSMGFNKLLGAEVANNPAKRGVKARRKELIEELRHVEFIARCWREDLERN